VQVIQGGSTSSSPGVASSGHGTLLILLIIGAVIVVIGLIALTARMAHRARQREALRVEPPETVVPT
jgi:flagellar basal body-associated protein FliL